MLLGFQESGYKVSIPNYHKYKIALQHLNLSAEKFTWGGNLQSVGADTRANRRHPAVGPTFVKGGQSLHR